MSGVIIRYHEVALKKGNRGWFEHRLAESAVQIIHRYESEKPLPKYFVDQSRIFLDIELTAKSKLALDHVFGIANYSPCKSANTELDAVIQMATDEMGNYLRENPGTRSFKIQTRRMNKSLPFISPEWDSAIGKKAMDLFPHMKVDLKHPELTIGVEASVHSTRIWSKKFSGLRGLPVGTLGKVLVLFSGGIDSPVAALQMMKRGAFPEMIHFYGTPFVGEDVLRKVEDLGKHVRRFLPKSTKLWIIPFGKIQEEVAKHVRPNVRTLIYRRLMLRISSQFAKTVSAQALVTGESLGQVASQTLENMTLIDRAASIPVFRPLIGHDKEEIIELARKWNTYLISIKPGEDCCTLFADKHPLVRAKEKTILDAESNLDIEELVSLAISQASFITL